VVSERCWNGSDRNKPTYSDSILPHCQFVHHYSHMDRNGIEHSGLCNERPASNLSWCVLLTLRFLGVRSVFIRSSSETDITKTDTNWRRFLKICTNTLLLVKFPSWHDVIFCDKQCQYSRLANIWGGSRVADGVRSLGH